MQKLYALILVLFLVAVANGQNRASTPCENPSYPVNSVTNRPPVPPSTWKPPQSAVIIVDLTIDKKGAVKDAVIVTSGGRDADDAVLKAVRNWTYSPAKCGFAPVEMTIRAKINLQLGKGNQ